MVGRVFSSLVNNFGYKVESGPMNYLGMPLGGKPKAISFWDLVVERV